MRRERHDGIAWRIAPGLTTKAGFDSWTAARVSRTAVHNLGRGPIPSLDQAGIRYRRDPVGCDLPLPWWQVQRNGAGDCKSLTAWELAREHQRTGTWPEAGIVPSGGQRLIHVRLVARDPSAELIEAGQVLPGRRSWGAVCNFATPFHEAPFHEAGQEAGQVTLWANPSDLAACECGADGDRRREDLIHWTLRELLDRGRRAGLPVYLTSGHRSWEDQVVLWEQRIAAARADGDTRAPPSWAAVAADWTRWSPWVLQEAGGRNVDRLAAPSYSSWRRTPGRERPALALPGTSTHQALPAEGADIGATAPDRPALRAIQDQLARLGSDIVHRPIRAEPWHFEPLPALLNLPAP